MLRVLMIFYLVVSLFWTQKGYSGDDPREKKAKKKNTIEVYTEEIKEVTVWDPLCYGGVIEASRRRQIFTETEGTILRKYVKPGDKVNRNSRLFTIDRIQNGYRYKKYNVTSPIDGVVMSLDVKEGDKIKPGQIMGEIASLDKLKTTIHVTYEDVISLNQKNVQIDLYVDKGERSESKLPVKISSIAPASDPITGTFAVELDLICDYSKCKDIFKVGVLSTVEIKNNFRKVVLVPPTSLDRSRRNVFLVGNDSKIIKRPVKLGNYYNSRIEVISGLNPGETLITKYTSQPKDGDRANITLRAEDKKFSQL